VCSRTSPPGVARVNAQLSLPEQIQRWTLLDAQWLPGGDELTPTMKLQRRPIMAKYAAAIEELYHERELRCDTVMP